MGRTRALPPLEPGDQCQRRQFAEADFADKVIAALARHGANPARLRLELTESLLHSDLEATIARMERLRQEGVRFSLDDFGTGYSSLSYLEEAPAAGRAEDRQVVRR